MFTQRVCHFVAHDHRGLIVGQLELVQDARVESNFATWHTKGIDLLAADQVHFPAPLARTIVPLCGVGNDALRNAAQPLQLRVSFRCQRVFGTGLGHHLRVLLGRRGFELVGRHQFAQAR